MARWRTRVTSLLTPTFKRRIKAFIDVKPAAPTLRPATGPITTHTIDLSPAIAEQVDAWFQGRMAADELSGERSAIIAHPEDPDRRLKIKGAGFRGAPLALDRRHAGKIKAPLFDYEGRMMDDVASGHDNAYLGAASFQQASVEYRISRRLAELGYPVIPCLGFGRAERDGRSSWFSVFDWRPGWKSMFPPHASIERYADQSLAYGAHVLELATLHRLIGYFWYAGEAEDPAPMIKDVHPFYAADPINMSRLSWTLQVFFALHIAGQTAVRSPTINRIDQRPADLRAFVFRHLVPDASGDEHEALRLALATPYMRFGAPADFDPFTLERLLREHRITRAIMERCPPEFQPLI